MWRRTLVIAFLLAAHVHADTLAGRRARCSFRNTTTQMYVERAVEGAMRRLAAPACQQLLTEFADASGVALRDRLDRTSLTALEFMATLHFLDGADTPQCRSRTDLAAFTAPGNRVIFVCGDRFSASFADKPRAAEMLIIHEVLHAVGLGENPPASDEITARVTRRCA